MLTLFRREATRTDPIERDGLFVYPDTTTNGHDLRDARLAVIDVETTGLSSVDDRVCEIAIATFEPDGTPLDEWATLVDPGCDVGPTFVHHITNEMVAGAPAFGDVVGEVLERLDGAVLVAHNAPFVEGFVRAELDRLGIRVPPIAALCTLTLARSIVHAPNYRLDTCCESFGISHLDAHSALGDCRATGRLATRLLGRWDAPLSWACPLPALPRIASTARPRTRATDLHKGDAGWMANLLARLPITTTDADPDTADAYVAALADALADGKLTGPEARQLGRLAGAAGLGAEQLRALHRRFLDGMREAAEEDDILTSREVRELQKTAELLDEADHFAGLEPTGLAVGPSNPRPVRGGPRVWCAPGIDAAVADQLRDAGYTLAVNLTKSVVAVVCDDTSAPHPKLRRARDLGLRLVAASDTAVLVAEIAETSTPSSDTTPPFGEAVAPAATTGTATTGTAATEATASTRTAAGGATAPEAPHGGAWLPDPFARADHRWFDGTRWTHHVARSGVVLANTPWLAVPADEEPGQVDGRPVDHHAVRLHELVRTAHEHEALTLGYRCIDAAENAAAAGISPVPHQLYALMWHLHTRRGEHDQATAILHRLAAQPQPTSSTTTP